MLVKTVICIITTNADTIINTVPISEVVNPIPLYLGLVAVKTGNISLKPISNGEINPYSKQLEKHSFIFKT